jgi:hypothetical protein
VVLKETAFDHCCQIAKYFRTNNSKETFKHISWLEKSGRKEDEKMFLCIEEDRSVLHKML